MNELIQNFAEQAEEYSYKEYSKKETGYSREYFFNNKFAELIVQECLGVLKRRYMGDQNREDMEVRRCIEDVKKHFGIE